MVPGEWSSMSPPLSVLDLFPLLLSVFLSCFILVLFLVNFLAFALIETGRLFWTLQKSNEVSLPNVLTLNSATAPGSTHYWIPSLGIFSLSFLLRVSFLSNSLVFVINSGWFFIFYFCSNLALFWTTFQFSHVSGFWNLGQAGPDLVFSSGYQEA